MISAIYFYVCLLKAKPQKALEFAGWIVPELAIEVFLLAGLGVFNK